MLSFLQKVSSVPSSMSSVPPISAPIVLPRLPGAPQGLSGYPQDYPASSVHHILAPSIGQYSPDCPDCPSVLYCYRWCPVHCHTATLLIRLVPHCHTAVLPLRLLCHLELPVTVTASRSASPVRLLHTQQSQHRHLDKHTVTSHYTVHSAQCK